MRNALALLLGFLYLNLLFTFENVPSTPVLRPAAKLGIEAVVLCFGMALAVAGGWKLSRLTKGALAAVLFVFTLVRYVDVTALGVLGRAFDLYGDAPHLHRVFQMFWEATSLSTGLLFLVVSAAVVAAALVSNWMSLGVLERALEGERLRRAVLVASPIVVVAFFVAPEGQFAYPTTQVVARQLGNLKAGEAEAIAASEIDWPAQNLDSTLEGLGGANVFILFLESYGVTLIEDPQHADRILPRYRELEDRLSRAGYRFASSQIQSPTFGGGSWRAHASFLSGFDIESEHLYNALLESDRETLVSVLSSRGYRTVAVEPGIKWYWPDGEFYGFDRIYGFEDIDYDGPPMGWWKVPDQFTLYRLYQREIEGTEKPLFAKVSLIMTHIPYFPVPSYVEDWTRFDDGSAYDAGKKSVAHDAYRDLRELSTWYVEAFRYELDVVEGFLLKYVPDNSLVVIVGDHQPPKLVTHDNDSWAVPIHVLSKRAQLVEAFEPLGFEDGLVPLHASALRMADFLDGFLAAFDVTGPVGLSSPIDE